MRAAFLRRKLAHRLRTCAARRRTAWASDATGHDLRAIELFGELARDAERLPQALVNELATACGDPAFERRFEQVWNTLGDAVGASLVPASAAELVAWMLAQARHDGSEDVPMPASPTGTAALPCTTTTTGE